VQRPAAADAAHPRRVNSRGVGGQVAPAPWVRQWSDTHKRVVYFNPTTGGTVRSAAAAIKAAARAEAERGGAGAGMGRRGEHGDPRAEGAGRTVGDDYARAASEQHRHQEQPDPAWKSCAVMHDDPHPPTVFTHRDWVSLRDALSSAPRVGNRAVAVHEVAKAMSVIQEDYATRFTSIGIKVRAGRVWTF
jgi:hypothetical protein